MKDKLNDFFLLMRRDFGYYFLENLDQARRLKEMEKETSRLKRLVADLSLDAQILKEAASGNC